MNTVALLDVLALGAFLVAFVTLLRVRADAPRVGLQLKVPMLVMLGLYLFVSFSNVVEHAGITSALDAYEDYAEVLFVPLVAYIVYSWSTAEQLAAATRAERAIRAEHDLLMSVVDTTPAGILVADADGAVWFANDLAERMLDLRATGQGGAMVCPVCADEGVVREGGTLDIGAIVSAAPLAGVLQTVPHDGDVRYMSVSATALPSENGGLRRAVLALEDVTERTMLERELEEYRQDLERIIDRRTSELLEVNRQLTEAARVRDAFLANMSHELRTPLNSIIGFTDVLLAGLSGPLTDEQRTQLAMVKESSTELLAMVSDVLDLARIEGGHAAVNLQTFDFGEHIGRLLDSMSALARSRGLTLTCECPPGPEVTSDPDKIGQVVRNLVANAIKFTDRGGAVTVRSPRAGGHAGGVVADTGIGIAPEDQERIFEAFQQVVSKDRAKPEGTGLGLAISRELCTLLGCDLSVVSAVGEGSVFTLRVPLAATPGDV
jgi:PAS domain S-box-containing protein